MTSMELAIQAVKRGATYREASETFSVPVSVLHGRCKAAGVSARKSGRALGTHLPKTKRAADLVGRGWRITDALTLTGASRTALYKLMKAKDAAA